MRNRLARSSRAALAAGVVLLVLAVLASPAFAAKVTLLQRPVEVKRTGQTKWQPLKAGDEVSEGDSIRTGHGGRVEITIAEKRVFRIGEASEVTLDRMTLKDGDMNGKVRVLLGRLWSTILVPLKESRGEQYIVETPTATMGVKGTRFGVDYDGKTKVLQTTVLEGKVVANPTKEPAAPPTEIAGPRQVAPPQQITEQEWVLIVSANQKLIFVPGQDPKVVPITDEDRADEWVKFNDARDKGMR
jgi:hypothetical protein